MYIADSSWKMLAWWSGDMEHVNPTWSYQVRYKYLPFHVMQKIVEANDLPMYQNAPHAIFCENRPGFPAMPFISKAIRKDGVHYGNFFILEFYRKLDACDFEIAEYLGSALSTALSGGRNYIETSTFYHAHFIEDVIEGTLTDRTLIGDQLKALSWELEGDYQIALIDTREDDRAICHYTMLTIEQDPYLIDVLYNGYILVVYADAGAHAPSIQARLSSIARDFNRNVGLSERFREFGSIATHYREAEFALTQATQQDTRGKLVRSRDYVLDRLSTAFDGELPLSSAVERLAEHDAAHGTELCLTLYEWLLLERNTVQTATKLYIHRNTCKNRIETIRSIVDEDLDDVNVRIELMVTLHQIGRARGLIPASLVARNAVCAGENAGSPEGLRHPLQHESEPRDGRKP